LKFGISLDARSRRFSKLELEAWDLEFPPRRGDGAPADLEALPLFWHVYQKFAHGLVALPGVLNGPTYVPLAGL
jgi:hypothetical protein